MEKRELMIVLPEIYNEIIDFSAFDYVPETPNDAMQEVIQEKVRIFKFSVSPDEWDEMSGELDEYGNRLTQNTESNGRFHTDWLNMIYPRLKIARDLLTDDGVIFISIDENEVENLKKICDEVFGEINYISNIIVKSNPRGSMSASEIASLHENLLIYTKNRFDARIVGHALSKEMTNEYKYTDNKGAYRLLGLRMRGGFWRRSERPNLYFPIYINPTNGKVNLSQDSSYCEIALPIQPSTKEDGTWRWSREKVHLQKDLLVGRKVNRNNTVIWDVFQKDYLDRDSGRRTKVKSIWEDNDINYQNGTNEIKQLLGKSGIFDYSKPVYLIEQAINMIDINDNDIILDFFSGSATTAHAVMRQNIQDISDGKKTARF